MEQEGNERGQEQQRHHCVPTIYSTTLSPAPLRWGGGFRSEGVKLCLGEGRGKVLF